MIGFILLFISHWLVPFDRMPRQRTTFFLDTQPPFCIYFFPFALNWRYYYHSIHFCTDSTLPYQQSRVFEAVVLFVFFSFFWIEMKPLCFRFLFFILIVFEFIVGRKILLKPKIKLSASRFEIGFFVNASAEWVVSLSVLEKKKSFWNFEDDNHDWIPLEN